VQFHPLVAEGEKEKKKDLSIKKSKKKEKGKQQWGLPSFTKKERGGFPKRGGGKGGRCQV